MTFDAPSNAIETPPKASEVPLGTGPPTREELLAHYPGKFTWTQLKTFINAGDLGLLKRDKKLQARYMAWSAGIKEQHGSMVKYLRDYRLQWGQPDRLCLIPSRLDNDASTNTAANTTQIPSTTKIPHDAPPYFTADTPSQYISIIMADWPYSVPDNVEHTLIWTRDLPIVPTDLPQSIVPRITQDGLWGFTGNSSPPPSPSTLPECLPALADWDVTMDKLIRSEKGTEEEEESVKQAGREIDIFVRRRWIEEEWETIWFVNPPRLQSVPGLAHIHVFARYKSPEERGVLN
ncbi:hypothetical protein EIP91_001780 [Steccherinum ochraceum]|uniref:Uncharacterized protein n=1 Tax=Steccherinum ochraceum TaxID=92696 RepID=A0A4R0RPV5_9APHY|nr:hypothetical protein EIP91_001780 [Steccherinum ochraceum]